MSFNIREWAEEELQAEADAIGEGDREWLSALSRGEGRQFNQVLEAAEKEAGRHIPAGEALTIAEVARAMLGVA